MIIRDLIRFLRTCDPELDVHMALDVEGDSYAPLSESAGPYLRDDSEPELTLLTEAEARAAGWTEAEIVAAERVVLLCP